MSETVQQNKIAVILTALEVETRAVLRQLGNSTDETVSGTGFFRGQFEGWDVAVAEVGAGNVGAAAVAMRACQHYKPNVALFVGVAGGVKDVAIGDAVVGTTIYGYESGKDLASGLRARPDVMKTAHNLEQRARVLRQHEVWKKRLDPSIKHNGPKVFVGPIAAGEKVVASKRAATAKLISVHYSDALAVEMEGRGFLEGVHLSHPVQGCVVRGISDLLSGKAIADKAESQRRAADAASAVAFEILSSFGQVFGQAAGEVWNLSRRVRGPFEGRDAKLDEIEEAIKRRRGVALHGLRGVGKSACAIVFANRHRDDYHGRIWWIDAETPASVRAGLVKLGERLGWLTGGETEEAAWHRVVQQQLPRERDPILLIYDNAMVHPELEPFIPQGEAVRLLITATSPDWESVVATVQIEPWDEEDGGRFLVKRAPKAGQLDVAKKLSRTLEGLPLAHEMAGAYCASLKVRFTKYQERFEAEEDAAIGLLSKNGPLDYDQKTVVQAFNVAIDRCPHVSEALLLHAALLAPEWIPLYVFTEAPEEYCNPLAASITGDHLDDALRTLLALALVDRDEVVDEEGRIDSLRLHRLVRLVARNRPNGKGGQDRARSALIKALASDKVYPPNVFNIRSPRARQLYPHVQELIGRPNSTLSEDAEISAASLLDRFGAYQSSALSRYRDSLPLFERSVEIRERRLGRDCRLTGESISHLASNFHSLWNLSQAQDCFIKAVEIAEKNYGRDHVQTAFRYNDYALLLRARAWAEERDDRQKGLAEAHKCAQLALDIRNNKLRDAQTGTEQTARRAVATSLNNLGLVLHDQDYFLEARGLLEKARMIRVKEFGANDPQTARILTNLGRLLHDMNEVAKAKGFLESALEIRDRELGRHHDTATSLVYLAALLQVNGEADQAREYYERALVIDRDSYGGDHPFVAEDSANLGLLLQAERCFDLAANLFELAVDVMGKRRTDVGDRVAEDAHAFLASCRHRERLEPGFRAVRWFPRL
jgi:nucleoside phosphorylase/tetratricopeptide (TPR) repeat protein